MIIICKYKDSYSTTSIIRESNQFVFRGSLIFREKTTVQGSIWQAMRLDKTVQYGMVAAFPSMSQKFFGLPKRPRTCDPDFFVQGKINQFFCWMCCSYKKKGLCLKWCHIYVYMHILYNCIRWFDIVKVLVAFGRFTVFWSHQILIRFNKQMWLHKLAKCLSTTGYLILTKLCGALSGCILKNPGFLAGCFPPVQPPMKADYWLSITSCVYRSCFFLIKSTPQ